jgi:sn-glycerol 3-phosphate transport system permease protein
MAGTIIAMIPPLIILFPLQSSFVKGFAMREEK